ncbi:MAG: hypothetical protein Q9183_000231 [Haloplaca sp. 2 TL-2023]
MTVSEEQFVQGLSDLTGKVAVVTGGAAGLGLQTTIYLAQRNCTVYVASRNQEKSLKSIAESEAALSEPRGTIKFHQLDLSSIERARQSAQDLVRLENRIDIIVANAGISMVNLSELSSDGFERMFATNHLGHFAFITELLG